MSRFLNEQYQAMAAYVPGEQPRDMEYIKLNTNENPYPPAPGVVAAMTATEVELLRLYSDPTCKGLKDKLAALYCVDSENVFVCNGSDEALNFAFMCFGDEGMVFPDITYGFYTVFGNLYGGNYREIPLKEDFSLDYQDFCNQNKMVIIANPNAPTGLAIPLWQIEEMLKTNPDHVVVIDEAYIDFGGETALPLIDEYENLLIIRTFSKSRCLAGGRLGYAFGSKALIADLEKLRYCTNPFNVDRLALTLGEATVDAEDYYKDITAKIIESREWTTAQLTALGFDVVPSQTNFVFAKTGKMDGGPLYLELKKRGILVRHFSAPRTAKYIRITIGTQAQMERFVDTVKEIIG